MKKQLEDKLSMALAAQQAMNDNNALWSGIPAMVSAMTTLGTKIASIKGIRGVQEADTRGVAVDKGSKKTDAINAGLPIIGGLKAYATATANNTLLKKINYSQSELERARDTILADQLKIVRDEANNILALLTPYNITTAKLTTLTSAIAAYELMIPKPRVALNVRKNATDALDILFSDLDAPLEIMDGLVDTMQQSQPAFFQTYSNARLIVGSSSGGSGVSGMITDKITGAPLDGVLITINAPQHKSRVNAATTTRTMTATTNLDGVYEMRRLRAGDYTLTMEKEGYINLSVAVTIGDAGVANGDGKMERVVPAQPPGV